MTPIERIEALLRHVENPCWAGDSIDALGDALRNAAPALLRLVKAALKADEFTIAHWVTCELDNADGWEPGQPEPKCTCGVWATEQELDEALAELTKDEDQ